MGINLIVAAGTDGAIGKDGKLIWKISADLKRFKEITMGHPVVMGRKTWESLPKKPLPGRRNIVVTRNAGYEAIGAETAASPDEALRLCDGEEPFIIGGEQIYAAMLPFADRIYLTRVEENYPEADAWFPPLGEDWSFLEEEETRETPEGVKYRFSVFKRKKDGEA